MEDRHSKVYKQFV